MASMIPIGMPINGITRRFSNLKDGRFLYSCPQCAALASNDQAFCIGCGYDLTPVQEVTAPGTA